MKHIVSIIFFCAFAVMLSLPKDAFATHNRAGEITYKCLGSNKYEITVTTYTKIQSPADRCELTVNFGDGDSAIVPRVNGPVTPNCSPNGDGVSINTTIRKNIYITTHTYPGPGQYKITMYDPNRNSGIENIPNSVNTPFFLYSYIFINPLLGFCNNSVVLTNPPIDNGCLYKCFYHNPGAYDPDGQDSIAYSLDTCLGYGGAPVPGYSYPVPASPNQFYMDAVTGDFVWCTPAPWPNDPSYPQQYNFAILIKEYRKFNNIWYLVGIVERDLQVDIDNCTNNPPIIADVADTCVLAGDTLKFGVGASDPDPGDIVTLSASGGPISITNPLATFTLEPNLTDTGTFQWNTTCNLVRLQPYQVVFKAVDNDAQNPLVDIETVQITIVAPPPRNLTASPQCNSMVLSWMPPSCNPSPDFITGYRIYRLNNCDSWVHAPCETGVPSYTGYVLVGSVSGVNTTTFTDNGLLHGVNYAYHVVAVLLDGAQSYASNKVCQALVRDVPIITNSDIMTTGNNDSVRVKWLKPLADPLGITGLDTSLHPGPYQYVIYRNTGFTNANTVAATFTYPNFAGFVLDSFIDIGRQTDANPYVYSVLMLAQNGADTLCRTDDASSVYLTLVPNDNIMTLNWSFNVPWNNYKYHIYRKIPSQSNVFTLLDSTTATTYTDSNLVNLRTYCYKIKAYGQYSDTSIIRPLINWSEEKCDLPVDKTPPCCPQLTINSDCNANENVLTWTNPNAACTGTDDVVSYVIYYTPVEGQDLTLLTTVQDGNTTTFIDDSLTSIAGCYQVAAIDSFGNQSAFCGMACADNCPIYDLPNVFTPNGDGLNDLFVPFPYKYVKDIDLHIYNRWGDLVFESNDPEIKWDGTHMKSKQLLSDGVYYYVCVVNEIRLKGIQPRVLKGFVQILQHK